MDELKEIYNMILTVWKHMKATVNIDTKAEADWKKLMDEEYKILAEFNDNMPLQAMCASYLAAWETYLERKGKDGTEKKIH